MIPKIIHYCWFGKNPKSSLILKCMESWKKYCPDYKIIEWNEENFDINCCDYVREAYDAKKWAFVSDYCRFFVLYKYGGIYLDTDVELIKKIKNVDKAFVGFESLDLCNSGLIRGAEKGDVICKMMLDSYHVDHFRREDGSLNCMTVCTRETDILCKFGLKRNNRLQIVKNTVVYPIDYFCPKDYSTGKIKITDNTISIHHYQASWHTEEEAYLNKVNNVLKWILPKRVSGYLAKGISSLKYKGVIKTISEIFEWVNKKRRKERL